MSVSPAPPAGLPPWQDPRLRPLFAIAAVLLFALVVVGLGNRSAIMQPIAQGPGEIFRQPLDDAGPNAFTASVSRAPSTVSQHTRATPSASPSASPSSSAAASPSPSSSSQTSTGGAVQVSSTLGSTPGLYGGTRNLSTCDSGQLVTYLRENPAKASAWVQAINSDPRLYWSGGRTVRVDQIGQFVSELTPVILRSDTRVTNHGFAGGRPDAYQSVLEAGTAVLVDAYGIPRVRCACGNPLIPPIPVSTTPNYTGPSWQGFSPTTIVVVQPPPQIITTIVIVDVQTGDLIGRRVGTTEDRPVSPESASPSPSEEPSETPSPTASPTPSSSPSATPTPSASDINGSYPVNVTGECFGAFSVGGTLNVQVSGTTINIAAASSGSSVTITGTFNPQDSSFSADIPGSDGTAHMEGRFSAGTLTGSIRNISGPACSATFTGHKS